MNEFMYLVRRETWENKSLYRAPMIAMLVLAAVSVLLTAKGLIAGDIVNAVRYELNGLDDQLVPTYLSTVSPMMMWVLFGIIITVSTIAGIFYLLDCLYSERKNRSIMFWKSLPISDTATVLSKLVAAVVVLPLASIAAVLAGWFFMQILGVFVLMVLGVNGLPLLWQPGTLFSGALTALEASIGLLLWYLPLAGYLMLVSAWAKRSTLMWAVFPPFIIIFLEKLVFNSTYFVGMLHERFVGFYPMIMDPSDVLWENMGHGLDGVTGEMMGEVVHLSSLLNEPGLYGGFAVAAVFITAAIFLRRYRNES